MIAMVFLEVQPPECSLFGFGNPLMRDLSSQKTAAQPADVAPGSDRTMLDLV